MIHTLSLAWLIERLFSFGPLLLNRIATWTGALSFYKKGRASGRKEYYVMAVLIYVVSTALLALTSSKIWHWLFKPQ